MLDLEMAQVQYRSGMDMLYIIYEAMAEHPDKRTDYAAALYGVYTYLKGVDYEISNILGKFYKE